MVFGVKCIESYLEQMVTQKDRAKEREQVLERVKELEKRSESTPYFPIMNLTPTCGEIWGIF